MIKSVFYIYLKLALSSRLSSHICPRQDLAGRVRFRFPHSRYTWNHRITGWKRPLEIIRSNHPPSNTMPTKPYTV